MKNKKIIKFRKKQFFIKFLKKQSPNFIHKMGCCQPAEQWNYSYDYPTEAVLKSYNQTTSISPHYQRKTPENINTSYNSPKKPLIFKEFQTPTQKNSNFNEDIELKRLKIAYNNEDLKALFSYVRSERLFEEISIEIKHKWVDFPRNLGVLSCIFIINILNSYINEEINKELFEEIKGNLKKICEEDEGFMGILLYFKGEIDGKRLEKLEAGFLMIFFILEFLEEFEEKTEEFLVKICLEYVNLFNLGFENRKIEVILVIFDILRRIHVKNDKLWGVIYENGLKIIRSLWFIYEISDKLYIFDEKVVIWFRILNFLDEMSKKDERRIVEIVKKFEQGNIKDLLKKFGEGLEGDKGKVSKFEENLKNYLEFLSGDFQLE